MDLRIQQRMDFDPREVTMQTEPPREVLDMFTLLPLRWRGRRRCKNSSTTNYRSSVLVLATRT